MRPRLLDLFCGAGGAAVGYHRAGFDVTGVDIKPQPRYPFPFIQDNALEYVAAHGREYDVIHASPPCQRYSVATKPHGSAGRHQDLVGCTREMLNNSGARWVIENVVGAPLIAPILLCGTMFGLDVFRHRLFEFGVFDWREVPAAQLHPNHNGSTGAHRGYSTTRSGRNGYICVAGHNFERKAASDAMGISWMTSRYQLSQAIPPAYTEFIGRQLLAAL